MPPSLPSKPTKDVTKISAAWIAQLLACVDYAMTHPGGDNGATIKDNGGSLSVVRPYHNTGASGTGGSEYKGPFAIVDNSDGTFKCVNNALSDAAQIAFPAGVVYFGYYTRSVAAMLNIPTDNIVWLESKYDGSDYVSELKCGTELPEDVDGVNIYVVGITGDEIDQQLRDNYDLKWVLV